MSAVWRQCGVSVNVYQRLQYLAKANEEKLNEETQPGIGFWHRKQHRWLQRRNG